MIQQRCPSFNNSEISNGLHLLTETSNKVEVNTPTIPPESAHLYPRLAGSDWTSYLSIPIVIVGRSEVHTRQLQQDQTQREISIKDKRHLTKKRQKCNVVHIDFPDCKAISRRHCEFRFSNRRDCWELYVHGRNGIKVNHVPKRPGDKPIILKTGTLIEISNTRFVFIIPNSFIRPSRRVLIDNEQNRLGQNRYDSVVSIASSSSGMSGNSSAFDLAATASNSNYITVDVHKGLETAIEKLFEDNRKINRMSTLDIMNKITSDESHYVDKEAVSKEGVLYVLVHSPKFRLSPDSVSISSAQSDNVEWMLVTQVSSPLSIISPVPPFVGKETETSDKRQKHIKDNFVNATTKSTEKSNNPSNSITQFPSSLSSILRDIEEIDVDRAPSSGWSFEIYTENQPSILPTCPQSLDEVTEEQKTSDSQATFSIPFSSQSTTAFTDANHKFPSYRVILPRPTSTITANSARLVTPLTITTQPTQQQSQFSLLTPGRFGGLPIEASYLLWSAACSQSSSNACIDVHGEVSVRNDEENARLHNLSSVEDSQSTVSTTRTAQTEADYKERNIYQEIRTKIVFS